MASTRSTGSQASRGSDDAGTEPTEAQIREIAYAIWETEGRPEGRAQEHWALAVRKAANGAAGSAGEARRPLAAGERGEMNATRKTVSRRSSRSPAGA